MRFHHLIGGLCLALAAAGLGTLLASPVLAATGRLPEAQNAREIGQVFLALFALPAMITILAMIRTRQVRTLEGYVDACATLLAPRYQQLTAPKGPSVIEGRRWSDEVWEFRRNMPKRLPLISDRAALKIVTTRIAARAPDTPASPRETLARRIAGALMRMGWSAQIMPGRNGADPFIAAQRYGIRLSALCVADGPVEVSDVQRALRAKAHMRADLAAIVSCGAIVGDARALAETHEVGLLQPGQIRAVHRAAGKIWRGRRRQGAGAAPAPAGG
ncbi:MAG: hypothetical protein GC206_05620 [Alphaproteobacteria bacterium]|nr:hypothetical protein [Alphaproteobacteria bacterium]